MKIEEFDDYNDDFTQELGIGEAPGTKKQEGEEAVMPGFISEGSWVIPYANLMTVLMIFFLMLYAYATIGGKTQSQYEKAMARISKEMGGDESHLKRIIEQEKETAAAEKMADFIKQKELSKYADIEINAQRVKIMLSNPVLFDIGSSVLKKESVDTLKEIAALIKGMDSDVVVEGHTDNIPIAGGKYRSNFELSAARAFSVIKHFIEEGIDQKKFTAFGYGEHRPLYPNDTEENRAKNRRIEINILRK